MTEPIRTIFDMPYGKGTTITLEVRMPRLISTTQYGSQYTSITIHQITNEDLQAIVLACTGELARRQDLADEKPLEMAREMLQAQRETTDAGS